MFDVCGFPDVPPPEPLIESEDSPHAGEGSEQPQPPLFNEVDLQEQFRGIMRKLAFCSASLPTLPDKCSFTLCIELKDQAEPPMEVRRCCSRLQAL